MLAAPEAQQETGKKQPLAYAIMPQLSPERLLWGKRLSSLIYSAACYTSVHWVVRHGLWHSSGTVPLPLRLNVHSMLKFDHKRAWKLQFQTRICPASGIIMSWAADVRSDRTPSSWWLQGENVLSKEEVWNCFLPIPSGSLSLGRRWLECRLVPQFRGPCWHSKVGLQSRVSSEQYWSLGGFAMNNFKSAIVQPCWVEFLTHGRAIRL